MTRKKTQTPTVNLDDDAEDVEEGSSAQVHQRWKAEEEKLLCETWIEVS
ncbi:hypothetical protein Tco_0908746, partial [Tanacetum coccineum]